VVTLSSFFNFSSSNYLALSMPVLGLYISFLSIVLYFYCCYIIGLLKNLKYPLLACYSVILSLNTIQSFLGMCFCKSSFRSWDLVISFFYSIFPSLGSVKSTFFILLSCLIIFCTASSQLSPLSFFAVSYFSKA
jgi:hypothetical protein